MRYFVIMMLMLASQSLNAAVAVAHNDVPNDDMSVHKARDLLLGRATTFSNGQAVILVLCMDEKADASVKAIAGRGANLLLRGWKRLVFSGSGAMPLQAVTISDALALVARTPGAFTILPAIDVVPQNCKIIVLKDDD